MFTTNKLLNKSIYFLATLVLVGLTIPATAQDKDKDKDYFMVSENKTKYEVVGWERETVYNPYTYTWYEWTEPIMKKEKAKVVHPVKLSEFDRPPVFDAVCLNERNNEAMVECTNREMQEFVRNNNFNYPDRAQWNDQDGLEYISFVLNKKGEFEGDFRILSKKKPCKGCSDAAADIVADMEGKWYPAIKDGKPVKTHITVPIRFDLVEFNE